MESGHHFIKLAYEKKALRFGTFVTKAGRQSPYFFNAGLFNDGQSFDALCDFYAKTIINTGLEFDLLFGPAYKGIPLAAGIAIRLARYHINKGFAFNRKEEKDHGEGGILIGAPMQGNVLIVDDVISAGTSLRESVSIIRAQGARPVGVIIALDRMEKGLGELSAVEETRQRYDFSVTAVATLNDMVHYLQQLPDMADQLKAVQEYRRKYGPPPITA